MMAVGQAAAFWLGMTSTRVQVDHRREGQYYLAIIHGGQERIVEVCLDPAAADAISKALAQS